MKKAIFEQYGDVDVIKLVNSDLPKLASNEVLIKVAAAGLNPKDILIRKGKFKRLAGNKFPKSIGFDFSGTIIDGNGSTYQRGDKVFGMLNGWKAGCCAELVHAKVNELYRKPENISFEDAAGIPLAGQTALQAIRNMGRLAQGQKICINGASGGVGTLAIQIAKELGGVVTTISSTKNVDFCKSLGADEALSYIQTNILESKNKFDLFFDVFGNYSFKKTAVILKKSGRYITTVPKSEIIKEQVYNLFRKKKASMVVVKSKTEDIKWLHDKITEQKIKPITDKILPLAEIQKAQKYIESKRARGKVILTT